MKKLICTFAVLGSLASFAAMEKVATVQVNNTSALTKASAKFGELIGNSMVSSIVNGAIADNPATKYFGPMRTDTGVSAVIGIYLDMDGISGTNWNGNAASAAAVVYPVAGGKAKFLKLHDGAKEQDGVICVDDDEFTAFSADGKWATKANTAALAKTALAEVELAQKEKMDGDVVRVRVNAKGLAVLGRAVDELGKRGGEAAKQSAIYGTWIKGAKAAVGSLKVSNAGVDFSGSLKSAADSTLAKFGKTSLASDPFKFATKDVISATAIAPGGWACTIGPGAVSSLFAFYQKELGVDLNKFLSVTEQGDDLRLVVDPKAAIAFAKGSELEGVLRTLEAKQNDAAFAERLMAQYDQAFGLSAEPSARGCNFSLAIKDYAAGCTMSKRFAAVLPEVSAKRPFACSIFSPVAVLQALVPAFIGTLSEGERMLAQPLLAQLPKEGKGGIASASWREGDTFKGLCRVSAAEIKSIGSLVNVGMSFAMMQAMQGGGFSGALNGANNDDDDEEDD